MVGKKEDVARGMLEESHLEAGTTERKYSGKYDEGTVMSADPAMGEELKPGTPVVLTVSKGAEPVAVPNVVGKPVAEAKVMIAEGDLRDRVVEKFNETVPAGVVVSQKPANGTADKNSVVQIVVSKGPPLVEVPGVVGKNVAEAQQIITAAGFVPAVNALPGGPGTVLNQSPGGGDKAPKGSTVTLYVF